MHHVYFTLGMRGCLNVRTVKSISCLQMKGEKLQGEFRVPWVLLGTDIRVVGWQERKVSELGCIGRLQWERPGYNGCPELTDGSLWSGVWRAPSLKPNCSRVRTVWQSVTWTGHGIGEEGLETLSWPWELYSYVVRHHKEAERIEVELSCGEWQWGMVCRFYLYQNS